MKRSVYLFVVLAMVFVSAISAHATPIFINEIHYDNAGNDTGEGIEIAGPAGTDLQNLDVLLYNGNDGHVYKTINLNGTIPDQQNGFGTVFWFESGIQNGAPDGMALVDSGTVMQFLSYEGSFLATDGPASGLTSTDIGLYEATDTPAGSSLQLIGTGSVYEDFTWSGPTPETYDSVNTGQTFVPLPNALLLLVSGLTGLVMLRSKLRK